MNIHDKILVVDDEAEVRTTVADALRSEGYLVATAPDGPTALTRLAHSRADLVLTDYRMPGMNGVELIRRIHQHTPHAPALLMTGGVERGDIPGIDAASCLWKPMDLDDLVWVIECTLACGASRAARASS